jgi:enamine deaminase RidA (YjgF/YER057c/UK114 family)
MLTKAAFNDANHWENQKLFSRGLRLSNFSEILFITGYGPAKVGGESGGQTDQVASPGQPAEQMVWIVQHLDDFFKTIPYADGSGQHYTKNDVVYFDLVVDNSITDDGQQAVLEILMNWFEDVDPKPSTGILKKVEGLAVAGMMVEIEFILAH